MIHKISRREREVLELISFGFSVKEMAFTLYLSEHTIITHKRNLFSKLDAPNIAALVRKGFERGLLTHNQNIETYLSLSA